MGKVQPTEIETIVNTLLNIGQQVFEISDDLMIVMVWTKSDSIQSSRHDHRVGLHLSDCNYAPFGQVCITHIKDAFATGVGNCHENKFVENGRDVYFEIRTVILQPGSTRLFLLVNDITYARQKELERQKLEHALEVYGDGRWAVDFESLNCTFSERWHELFGFRNNEIVTLQDCRARLHPDDFLLAQETFDKHVEGVLPVFSTEIRFLCEDNKYRWVLLRGLVTDKTADGKPLRMVGTRTHIQQHKVLEEQHASAHFLLSLLIENIQEGIMVTDHDGRIMFVNQMFCDLFNYSYSPRELVGMEILDSPIERHVDIVDEERYVERLRNLVAGRSLVMGDEFTLFDGRIISRDYVPVTIKNVTNGQIWKFKDVTEQKNIDKRFQEQRLFYERILNSVSAEISVFDCNYRYLFVNPFAVKEPDVRKWLIGRTDEEYCKYVDRPTSIAERRREIFETVKRKKRELEWEEKIPTPDGRIEYFLRHIYPVFNINGTLDIIISYGMDVTERVQAREALQTSQNTFESAFSNSGIGMGLVHPNGKWLNVNKVLCDLTGYSKEDLRQQHYNDITYKEDKELENLFVKKMYDGEISTYSLEKRLVSKQGKIVLVLLTVSLVWNADDTPRFFISQVMDITKKKELENELVRKNADLEATRVSLVNKINQLEELSNIIAHNLRGPAGNIKMIAGMLMEQMDQKPDDDHPSLFTDKEAVTLISESTESLMNSLTTLMEVTKIKLNKSIPYDDCNIEEVINGIIAQLHGIIYEKHAEIELNLEVKNIRYPKIYMENIFYNLISNALKYCRLDVPPKIAIYANKIYEKIYLVVKDNGLGIDLDRYKDKIFKLNQVFHQGYDSKGVGLYITKTQIESLGGTITLKSKINEGTEFLIEL